MPLFIGVPYQPYSFLIKKLDDLIIAQDDKGRVRFSGTDASTVIQSAIDALTSGGKIFIKAGTYVISKEISLGQQLSIKGEGSSTVLKIPDGLNIDFNMLKGDSLSNVTIENLCLDGNLANQTAGNQRAIYFTNSNVIRIRSCIIKNWRYEAVSFGANNSYVIVEKNYFEGGNDDHLDFSASYSSIVSNIFRTPTGYAIDLDASWTSVIGNSFHGGVNFPAIVIGAGMKGNAIIGNAFDSPHSGIFMDGASYNIIMGNIFETCFRFGVRMMGASHNLVLSNIFHKITQWSGYASIELKVRDTTPSTYNLILQNDFYNEAGKEAEYFVREWESTDDYNIIRHNRFIGASISPVYTLGANTVVKENDGFVTENSGTETGTGAQQTIPHGCDFTPSVGEVILTNIDDGANPYLSAVPDATNIYVTAVSGKAYRWEVKKS